jgi:hypothetical protein
MVHECNYSHLHWCTNAMLQVCSFAGSLVCTVADMGIPTCSLLHSCIFDVLRTCMCGVLRICVSSRVYFFTCARLRVCTSAEVTKGRTQSKIPKPSSTRCSLRQRCRCAHLQMCGQSFPKRGGHRSVCHHAVRPSADRRASLTTSGFRIASRHFCSDAGVHTFKCAGLKSCIFFEHGVPPSEGLISHFFMGAL